MNAPKEPGCSALGRWAALASALQPGLQGLEHAHRELIHRSTAYACSVDLDEARREAEPQAPRWDYVLVERDGATIACEVHPARASEVDALIAKKRWAEQRLAQYCGLRIALWHWLRPPGSKQQFTPRSPGARRLAQSGIRFPAARLM
jgi:hypothetical protein